MSAQIRFATTSRKNRSRSAACNNKVCHALPCGCVVRQSVGDPERTVGARVPTDRIDDRCADCLLLSKSYGISAPQVLLEMDLAVEQSARHLGKLLAPIRAFLSTHYTIKDLLDPSVP